MAEEQQNQDEQAPKSKKTLMIVAGLMVLEAALVYAVVGVLGSGPAPAAASELEGTEQVDREAPMELLLVEDRFQNLASGRVWGWQAEVYLKIRKRNEPEVSKILESHKAGLREGIALIFRRARDRHLREPGMDTLRHQINAYVQEIFGTDADELPIVDDVIIAKLKGTPEDL